MRIFPGDGPRPTTSEAERSLYRALAKAELPGWTAWHSLRVRTNRGLEGEGDFVVINPERGLLVLEVKGGRVELRGGRWHQNGAVMKESPRLQGQGYVRKLATALKDRGAVVPAWGVGCAFPDCDFSEGPGGDGLDGLVLGRRQLAWMAESLPRVLERAVGERAGRVPEATQKALHGLWGETWVPTVRLVDKVEDSEERRVELDEQQLQFLDSIQDNPRVLSEGPAGSGKTLLAMELARRRARQGDRVLMLCFTDALAGCVDRLLEDEFGAGRTVRCSSVRQEAVRLLKARGLPADGTSDQFWREISAVAAEQALPPEDERPAYLIVDEGQDFEATDWSLVDQLSRGRALWVFRGLAQSYWDERHLPEALRQGMFRFALNRQYRSPRAILDFARLYTAGVDQAGPYTHAPEVLRLKVAAPRDTLAVVRQELDSLRQQGARPQDIAVLTLTGMTRSGLFKAHAVGEHRLFHADHPESRREVVVDTFLRFKGLERPFVLITDLTGEGLVNYDVRMHVALTRAQVGAVVVASPEAVEADRRLKLLPVAQPAPPPVAP